jgi:TrmH family RNA methyltransferase
MFSRRHFTILIFRSGGERSIKSVTEENYSSLPQITRAHAEELQILTRDSSERERTSSFLIEGQHLIERALESAPERIKEIIFTDKALQINQPIIKRAEQKNIPCSHVSQKLSERISDTKTPQGIFGVILMPKDREILPETGILLVLDNVQDPGNVGTIIRTASWFGIRHLLLSAECADPYSPKVLRSTQGEIFSTKVGKRGGLENFLRILHKKDWQILAATLTPEACSLYKMPFKSNVALILGSEAHGVSKAILDIADGQIMIPKYGEAESLNVGISAGIILAEIMRKNKAE